MRRLPIATVVSSRRALPAALAALSPASPSVRVTERDRDPEDEVRLAFAYASPAELEQRRRRAATELDEPSGAASRLAAHGVTMHAGAPLRTAFLFPGQGSQYSGMLRALHGAEPSVRAVFDVADTAVAPFLGERLSDVVFGADPRLHRTEYAQPAMLAADVALARLVSELGFAPDLVLGHSLGDYAAFVTAGAMSLEDALIAVQMRAPEVGRLEAVDPGGMASVAAGSAEVEAVLRAVPGYVVAANRNAHTQTVISGETEAVDEAVRRFLGQGIAAARIPVSHGFHSAILAPAARPMAEALSALTYRRPALPVVSSVTGELVPNDPAAVLGTLANQITQPVEFVRALETAWELGARLFVEVGPNRVLTGFAREVLGPRGAMVVAVDHPRQPLALAGAVAAMWALGTGAPARQIDNG